MPEGIQDALLIYNPTSGGKRHRRVSEIEQAVEILSAAEILAVPFAIYPKQHFLPLEQSESPWIEPIA